MNARSCQEIIEESGVGFVGRGRGLPQRDDEAGMDAGLASTQSTLDRGEDAKKSVKATSGTGSTEQGGCRLPRLLGTDGSRFELLATLAGLDSGAWRGSGFGGHHWGCRN